jgi:mono/diheme cytochrome c family protein
MVTRPAPALLFVVPLLSSLAVPAVAADAAHGATIAKRWCASCHVVAEGQHTAVADAPSFVDVATRHANDRELANFLADPHPKMPDMHLSRNEIADIVGYIRSLAPKPDATPEPADKVPERPKNG